MPTRLMRLGISRWDLPRKLLRERKVIYECLACETKFRKTDQTNQERRNGQCPSCGYKDLKIISGRNE